MKVKLQTLRVFLALMTMHFVKAVCPGSPYEVGKTCCDKPFCCDDPDGDGCPLEACSIKDECPDVSGKVSVVCNYRQVTCTDVAFPKVDCECKCKLDTDCDSTRITCPFCDTANGQCKPKTCPVGRPLNTETCECGCTNDVSCIGLQLSCPECLPSGLCSERDCPDSKACCKATRGNDLVCANGCGSQNVCFQLNPELNGGLACSIPAKCLASEFDGVAAPDTVNECLLALANL